VIGQGLAKLRYVACLEALDTVESTIGLTR